MRPTAILFIDGSNFYHSLREQGCLPFGAGEFKKLFERLSAPYDLKKIYFYDAVKNVQKDPDGYSKQQGFHSRLLKSHANIVIRTRKLRYLVNITDRQIENAGKEAGIIDSCKYKLKKFLLNLNVLKLTKEKGIDVQLVVDAIEEARKGAAGTMIILSGDADFVPAVRLIKSYNVKTVNLHPYSGSSTELRNACDRHILIEFGSDGPFFR
jgi:uncharacterized LabA/DUF88 family protein